MSPSPSRAALAWPWPWRFFFFFFPNAGWRHRLGRQLRRLLAARLAEGRWPFLDKGVGGSNLTLAVVAAWPDTEALALALGLAWP